MPILGYEELPHDDKSTMNKMLATHIFKIPQVVLGESLVKILERKSDIDEVSEYTNMLINLPAKLEFAQDRFPPPTPRVFKIASDLYAHDNKITNMDALILAHPIADNTTAHFYTDDSVMQSAIVQTYVNNCIESNTRTQKLNILPCFTQY